MLVVLALLVGAKRGVATRIDVIPKWDWGTVSFWSTIAYAMSGLEMAAMMGAEIHEIGRAHV